MLLSRPCGTEKGASVTVSVSKGDWFIPVQAGNLAVKGFKNAERNWKPDRVLQISNQILIGWKRFLPCTCRFSSGSDLQLMVILLETDVSPLCCDVFQVHTRTLRQWVVWCYVSPESPSCTVQASSCHSGCKHMLPPYLLTSLQLTWGSQQTLWGCLAEKPFASAYPMGTETDILQISHPRKNYAVMERPVD